MDERPDRALHGDDSFLTRLGARVRRLRLRRKMSRRELAEASGVSQRYLARLEAGDGNVSITLLRAIAAALEVTSGFLVSDESEAGDEAAAIARLYRMAGAEPRARVREILEHCRYSAQRQQRIALIGLRGAGKSTLGRMLADDMGVPFIELNSEISKASAMKVNDLIALYGRESYRQLERQSVERVVAQHSALVLAVAGGIVAESDTFRLLLERFHTIWLKASPEDHMERVRAQGDFRPMAGNPAAMSELKAILVGRETLYERAGSMIDTSGQVLGESFRALRATVSRLPLHEDEQKNEWGGW
ncbi:MAG: helix-turn-helix transcriptional regulator [Hyphomicrobiales bacterium]|nr:helix-turn-helix transcriptional regulator [Hyphomicrobiales bacterium]